MRILVTGANGHLGQACVRDLLEHGYEVRASVRNLKSAAKIEGLSKLDIELVEADLFDQGSLDDACKDCDGVFQLAACYQFFQVFDEHQMVKTGTEGAKNLLRAAEKSGVSRVVLTSSIAAIGPTTKGMPPATETDWNTDISIPYFRQKIEGERAARDLVKELSVDLVTVCPGMVIGPYFRKNTPSVDNIEAIAKGALFWGAPNIRLALVDVRDAAIVHRLSFERGISGGRYLAVENSYSMYSIVKHLNTVDPKIKLPLVQLPSFFNVLLPLFDAVNSRICNCPRIINREMEKAFRGKDFVFSGDQTRIALNWEPNFSLTESLAGTLDTLRENGRYSVHA